MADAAEDDVDPIRLATKKAVDDLDKAEEELMTSYIKDNYYLSHRIYASKNISYFNENNDDQPSENYLPTENEPTREQYSDAVMTGLLRGKIKPELKYFKGFVEENLAGKSQPEKDAAWLAENRNLHGSIFMIVNLFDKIELMKTNRDNMQMLSFQKSGGSRRDNEYDGSLRMPKPTIENITKWSIEKGKDTTPAEFMQEIETYCTRQLMRDTSTESGKKMRLQIIMNAFTGVTKKSINNYWDAWKVVDNVKETPEINPSPDEIQKWMTLLLAKKTSLRDLVAAHTALSMDGFNMTSLSKYTAAYKASTARLNQMSHTFDHFNTKNNFINGLHKNLIKTDVKKFVKHDSLHNASETFDDWVKDLHETAQIEMQVMDADKPGGSGSRWQPHGKKRKGDEASVSAVLQTQGYGKKQANKMAKVAYAGSAPEKTKGGKGGKGKGAKGGKGGKGDKQKANKEKKKKIVCDHCANNHESKNCYHLPSNKDSNPSYMDGKMLSGNDLAELKAKNLAYMASKK